MVRKRNTLNLYLLLLLLLIQALNSPSCFFVLERTEVVLKHNSACQCKRLRNLHVSLFDFVSWLHKRNLISIQLYYTINYAF